MNYYFNHSKIGKPLKVKSVMTQSHTLKIIVLIWLLSILMNIPWILLTEYTFERFSDNGQFYYRCGTISRGNWTFAYMILTTFVFYALIGIILIFLYNKISKNLKNSNKFLTKTTRKKEGIYSKNNLTTTDLLTKDTKSSNTELNYGESNEAIAKYPKHNLRGHVNLKKPNRNDIDNKAIKNRKKLITMIMWVIVCFYICLTPIKAWNLVLMFGSKIPGFFQFITFKMYWYFNITSRIFFYLNNSINPILYNCLSKKFRTSFKKLLIFKFCFSNSNSNSCERCQTYSLS